MKAGTKLFAGFQPALSALLSGTGTNVAISQTLIDQLNSAWNSLANYASPALRVAMETERSRFHGFQDFVGKNFSQWAGLLQIPAPTQPWIFLSRPKLTNRVFSVEANEVLGRSLRLWRSPDLKQWTPVIPTRSITREYTVELSDTNAPPPPLFYRASPE
jgi:hypothetical protein